MLYEIDDACLASMDRVEGVPAAYRRERVTVFADRGQSLEAITYVANRMGEFLPSKAYVEVILRGARAHGLPAGYVQMLERTGTAL